MNEQHINEATYLPKYQKVYQYITDKIQRGDIARGSKLPSIIELSIDLDISKDTVSKAYRELIENEIIISVSRRGYFVKHDLVQDRLKKVLLLIADSSFENKNLYDELVEQLQNKAELFTYCCYTNTFQTRNYLQSKMEEFDFFILSPFNTNSKCDLAQIAESIPFEKQLNLIDRADNSRLFELNTLGEEIFRILLENKNKICSYQRFHLVLPENRDFHYQTIKGFQKFCEAMNLDYLMLDGINAEDISKNEIYLILDNEELFKFIRITNQKQFELGYDIGLISLNEKPFKEYIGNGISTISINFAEIAGNFCRTIINGSQEMSFLQLSLIDRNSF